MMLGRGIANQGQRVRRIAPRSRELTIAHRDALALFVLMAFLFTALASCSYPRILR